MSEPSLWQLSLSSSIFAGLIHAYDHPVAEDSLHMEHPDPPFAAWLVREGNVTVRFKGDAKSGHAITARKDEWLLLPARSRIHRMTPGTHLLSIRMNLERTPGTDLLSARQPVHLSKSKVPHLSRLANCLVRCMADRNHENLSANEGRTDYPQMLMMDIRVRTAFLLWIEAYLGIVLSRGWRLLAENTGSAPVEKVVAWIQQQGFSKPLRQSEMARNAGFSPSHLKRIFQRDLGISPVAWYQNRRFKEACRLLRGTDLPLKALADGLAFRFPSHFSIWFRRRSGMSPLEFRRKLTVDV